MITNDLLGLIFIFFIDKLYFLLKILELVIMSNYILKYIGPVLLMALFFVPLSGAINVNPLWTVNLKNNSISLIKYKGRDNYGE